ncbi:MAG: carboxypeptidase-like regulatory domain-containing protein, partial [Muribaculaceae bacterium]|nr:carboxypeptidase-like regulatory domain-containing protein [Muribaculaceae bacterium]
YLYTNADNMFLSLKRMSDTRVTYHRVTSFDWTCELANNFSFVLGLKHERQEATRWLPFVDGYGNRLGHYNESSVSLQLRYAPGEKFYQTKTHRIPVNLDAPVFQLTHTLAFKGFAGSRFDINKTELSVGKRFWLSAFGYIDAIISGGHVWSRSPYLNLLIPNANLSYTIQPESFALMNPMEFINDSYAQWDLTYWANGLLFNQIPFVKKAKLREVVSFRGLYGHLSRRNDPQYNPELFRFPSDADTRHMNQGPYMEISVGIDNILRCLRLDYVWRLTYRRTDYPVDHSGLRLALHFTF